MVEASRDIRLHTAGKSSNIYSLLPISYGALSDAIERTRHGRLFSLPGSIIYHFIYFSSLLLASRCLVMPILATPSKAPPHGRSKMMMVCSLYRLHHTMATKQRVIYF